MVSKQHAFAIISNHPRSSKDRSLRVQTMSRFVALRSDTIYTSQESCEIAKLC